MKILTKTLRYVYDHMWPISQEQQADNAFIVGETVGMISPFAKAKIESYGFTCEQAIIGFLDWKYRIEEEKVILKSKEDLSIKIVDHPVLFLTINPDDGMIIDVTKT